MAKLNYIKAAAKDIYTHGKEVSYVSKKGKQEGQTLTKIDKTLPRDENDTIFIKKGEPYYWWQFMYRPKQYSKTPPKPSELINSPFLSSIAQLQERIEAYQPESKDDFESFRDEIAEEIQNMSDECQEKLDSMPESLQSAPSGETLSNRVEELDNWKSEVEAVECEDEDEDADEDDEKPWDTAMQELQDTSYNGE